MLDDTDKNRSGVLPADPFLDADQISDDGSSFDSGWGPAMRIEKSTSVPNFPLATLPDWLRSWTQELSESLQCPVDLPACLALAVLSAASTKRYQVRVRESWIEPVNLYIAVGLASGESKSPAFTEAMRPIHDFEIAEGKRMEPEISEAAIREKVLKKRVSELEKKASKSEVSDEREDYIRQASEAAEEVCQVARLHAPRLLTEDTTAERLATLLQENQGRMAIFSDEGGPFELMAGRYSDGQANIEVYLKGYSGTRFVQDRVMRGPVLVPEPALTIGVAVQPEVLAGLSKPKGFRGKGLLARFMFSLPTSRVGKRDPNPKPMEDAIRSSYSSAIQAILTTPLIDDGRGGATGAVLRVADEAHQQLVEFVADLEPKLGPGGPLHSIGDWCNKQSGRVVRLAGLLRIAEDPHSHSDPWQFPIEERHMKSAIELAHYFLAHAQEVFDLMEAGPAFEDARRVWSWIVRREVAQFTQREAYRGIQRAGLRADQMPAVLGILEEHNLIRRVETASSGPGRPSALFEVHPRGVMAA